MNIGILVTATRRYIQLIPPLHASFERYFLPHHTKRYFVFTDSKKSLPQGIEVVPIVHQSWPSASLLKFHRAVSIADKLSELEAFYICDADMRAVAEVGEEILPTRTQPLIGVRHPYEVHERRVITSIERNQQSTAYVAEDETFPYYLRGGFLGGRTKELLSAAATIQANIDADLKKGIVAIFHEESHWHRYYVSHPRRFKVISHAYSYNERLFRGDPDFAALYGRDIPSPKIIDLAKNDAYYRDGLWAGIRLWFKWKIKGLRTMVRHRQWRPLLRQVLRLGLYSRHLKP